MKDEVNMKEDETFKLVSKMIDEAFSNHYTKEKKMENQPQTEPRESELIVAEAERSTTAYLTIEDYTRQTGKRFRMTKDQKARDLSREDAFTETFGENN